MACGHPGKIVCRETLPWLKNKFVARVKRCSILAASVLYSVSMWWHAAEKLWITQHLRKGMEERDVCHGR
jgi:hypothetical protein